MARADVTAAFILSSSIAILASAQVGCSRHNTGWLSLMDVTGDIRIILPSAAVYNPPRRPWIHRDPHRARRGWSLRSGHRSPPSCRSNLSFTK